MIGLNLPWSLRPQSSLTRRPTLPLFHLSLSLPPSHFNFLPVSFTHIILVSPLPHLSAFVFPASVYILPSSLSSTSILLPPICAHHGPPLSVRRVWWDAPSGASLSAHPVSTSGGDIPLKLLKRWRRCHRIPGRWGNECVSLGPICLPHDHFCVKANTQGGGAAVG